MPLSAGTRLGPYEVLSQIGSGGMGEVYKARDTRLNRTVAIKVLPEHRYNTPQARERFEREAKAISSLNHPHICTLHDVGQQDGIDYLVMEYLEGQTLANRLKRGPLPLDQVLQLAIEITEALDAAHRHGVIHRDLKPGNIVLTKSGVKLLDFGLAKVRTTGATAGATALPTETALTGEGTLLGTLQYMAPEQLEGQEADGRTDIFALGAVIYEMGTGRKAFEGKGQASLISAILTAEPPPISTLQSMAPPALDHVVRTCLAKEPEMRWQNAQDISVELKWIVDAGWHAGLPKPVVGNWKRRELLLSALLASVFIALVVVTVAYFRRSPGEVRPVRFSIPPPENVTFADFGLAGPALISPDGSRLAFVGVDDKGKHKLWVRPLDALAAQPLAETAEFAYPFWSPDSRYIAFFAEGKLKKVSAGGGSPQVICDAPNGRGGTWARALDGGPGIIVFAPDKFVALARVSAAGGTPVQVTALDSSRKQMSHRQPEFLPDGRHFLYAARDRADNSGVFIGDIQSRPDARNARLLMAAVLRATYAPPGYLLFPRDNNVMVQAFDAKHLELGGDPWVVASEVDANDDFNTSDFSVSANGVLAWRQRPSAEVVQLAWFDRSGKQIPGLDARLPYGEPHLSPDGKRVAVGRQDIGNIWLLDLVRGSASRFTLGAGAQDCPIWSPDGRRIVFASEKRPEYALYWKDSSGAGKEELLLRAAEGSIPTDWSRDGRFILFQQLDPKMKGDIWVLPLAGDRKPVPVLETEFNEHDGQFSPDGHWIAYASDESGRDEVYVRSFTEGARVTAGKWLVSTAGGGQPRWRRDGKELFYQAPDGRLMSVPVKAGSTFEPGIPVALFDTHVRKPDDLGYDVRADGQRFLLSRALKKGAYGPVNVCLNWLAAVKK